MILAQSIETTEIYLAASWQPATNENSGMFVQISIAIPGEFDRYESLPRTRLLAPDPERGSQKALRHVLNCVNASEDTVLFYTLPYPAVLSDEMASQYPRLTLEVTKKTENPAWARLLAYTSRLKAI
jgi:hypothetical protein